MPYIKQEDREPLKPHIENLGNAIDSEGELNYVISMLLHAYMRKKGIRYGNMNAVVGVLECAKMEFYRQVAAAYEDAKIFENGNIDDLASDVKGDAEKSFIENRLGASMPVIPGPWHGTAGGGTCNVEGSSDGQPDIPSSTSN